jgi:hypothetical protein
MLSDTQTKVRRAMNSIEAWTCIKFVKWTDEKVRVCVCVCVKRDSQIKFYVKIGNSGDGCESHIGRRSEKEQPNEINLEPRCFDGDNSTETIGRAVHELMHTLGFIHEQSRPDRRNFITLNEKNIQVKKNAFCCKKNNVFCSRAAPKIISVLTIGAR